MWLCVRFQARKLKGSDEHLSVERSAGGQDLLVSHHKPKLTRGFSPNVTSQMSEILT